MPSFTSHRGLTWNYETAGHGDVILFIHGFGGTAKWWGRQSEFLKRDFQVIAVDLPGHGQSAWMPVTLLDMAMDLRQMLRALGIEHLSVVASSFGGLVALELYRLMPEAVMRMSFVGSIPKFARSDNYPAGLDIAKIRTLSGQFDGDYAAILDIFFRSLFTPKERDSENFKWVKQLRQEQVLPKREALKSFLDILEKSDLRDRLASVICPLQFITGEQDYICPAPIMEWVSQHTHNARFDVVAQCGHLPFLTEVAEYNRLLEDFLMN